MKKASTTALLLAVLILAGTLAGCGGGNTPASTTAAVQTTAVPEETVDPNYVPDDLGDIDLTGKTFTLWIISGGEKYYIIEEETGEILNDACFARNRAVEERFNLGLNFVNGYVGSTGTIQNQNTQAISAYVLSGDTTYDALIQVQHSGMPGLILQELFLDYNEVPHVDFTKPYWYSKVIDDINYGSKIYTMSGSYHLNTLTSANCLTFNKNLFTDYGWEYPYKTVLDDKWTIDRFQELVEQGSRDLNGDGTLVVEDDIYAYGGWQWESIPALYMGMGGDILIKDENNMPVIAIETERNQTIVEKIYKVFEPEGSYFEGKDVNRPKDAFIAGQMLFFHTNLSGLASFRDMEDDFGFLPYPKLDESQETYNVRIQNTSGLTYIPVTNNNLDVTGIALEALAAYSYNMVVPVYFDQVLTYKTARDVESEQMVPYFRTYTSYYDEAASFSVITMITGGKALATYWAERRSIVEQAVADMIALYK